MAFAESGGLPEFLVSVGLASTPPSAVLDILRQYGLNCSAAGDRSSEKSGDDGAEAPFQPVEGRDRRSGEVDEGLIVSHRDAHGTSRSSLDPVADHFSAFSENSGVEILLSL